MIPSAYGDTFARDHLPPIEQWPELIFELPDYRYPDRLNCVTELLDRWPRRDFPAEFEAVLADEVRAHPDSVRMSWLESVAAAHVPGFEATNFLDGLRASGDFA